MTVIIAFFQFTDGEDVILLQNKEIVPFSDIYVPIGKGMG